MKKFLLLFIIVFCNIFAWKTYETESGGIGIYQNCVTGADSGQILIFKENNKYNLGFVTQKYQLSPWQTMLGDYLVEIEYINDLEEGKDAWVDGRFIANNATQFVFENIYKDFLLRSKWVKFTIPTTGRVYKTFKFDFTGFSAALKKVKE